MKFKDRRSIYLQIADHICDEILRGKWQEAERIPSARQLAFLMDVNLQTILRSFDYLQNRDIIFNKRGQGYSVSASGKKQIVAYRKERFIEQELPLFMSTLELLNISMDEVKTHYDVHLRNKNT